MKFNWKNYLATIALLASSLFSGYSQEKEQNKSVFVDSVMTEAKKYPTTTHFIYEEIMKNSEYNFHDINKLEKIIKNVEKSHEKKQEYSKEEVIEILKTTAKEIKDLGFKVECNKFDCDDHSFIFEAINESYKNKLNLYCMLMPGHMAIIYDCKNDGHDFLNANNSINEGDFNWETINTTINKIKPDKNYIKEYGIPKKLTKQQLIAHAYFIKGHNISNGWWIDNWAWTSVDYNLRIKELEKAVKLDSSYLNDLVLNYCGRGAQFFESGYFNSAIKDYTKAIELNPNESYLYEERGRIYKDFGYLEKANADFRKYKELSK